jgi:glycosyltransferase involved in cell wall biosynthesis
MKTLSIIIPVYNERNTILGLLRAVENSDIGDIKKEIILVDDYSSDGTREILEKLKGAGEYKIIFQDKNYGKGKALRTGFSHATGDFILVQDADLEYNPKEYKDLLDPILSGEADVVYGSRFIHTKRHGVLFFWHYIGNKILTVFSNMMTGLYLTDMETCYKVFTIEALKKITPYLTSNRFDIEPEITALVAHEELRIFEVGISYSSRSYNEGKKINWKDGFSALFTIIKSRLRFSSLGRDRLKTYTFFILLFLVAFSILTLKPQIAGDSLDYIRAMEFYKTGFLPSTAIGQFRSISTYLGLHSIIFVNSFFQNLSYSWLLVNSTLYVILGMFFYSLVFRLFKDSIVAFLSTLLLMTNYAAISFGLAYLMDIGGLAFYVVSIYFSLLYVQKKRVPYLFLAALISGIGGLWKENALFAYIVILGSILFVQRNNLKKMFKYVVLTGICSFLPFVLINSYFYYVYGYTYISWFLAQSIYVYPSRIIEYVKSFGSLYNFGWFLFIPGFYIFNKNIKKVLADERIFFTSIVLISVLPVFTWGAITQRILFVTIPGLILISALFIEKIKNKWILILPIFILYIASSFLMDSYILPKINIQYIISHIL